MCGLLGQQGVSHFSFKNKNLLLGSSITEIGLHRGPNTRYILYNETVKI